MLCIVFVLLICFSTTCLGSEDRPEPSVTKSYKHTYQLLVYNQSLSWQAAEQVCQTTAGHLVSVSDPDEEGIVEELCFHDAGSTSCWIGLNDLQDEGHYVFTDLTPVNYTRWYTAPWTRKWESEPNDKLNPWGQQDCVLLDSKRRGWHDEHCNELHPFICKQPLAPPAPVSMPGQQHSPGSSAAGAAADAAKGKASSGSNHQLLWGLLGGIVGGLLAFELVYLSVVLYRRRGGSWSGWRPTFDAVTVMKQVEMTSMDDLPDLVEGRPPLREVVRETLQGAWTRVAKLFSRGYSELPS